MSILSCKRFAIVLAMTVTLSMTMHGQSIQGTEPRPGKLMGTVTDVNGDPVPNATVTLETPESHDHRALVTPENGFFEFDDLKPSSYQVNITAKNFADWTSPAITLEPGQFKIVTGAHLRVATERTTVDVHYDSVEVATEQFKSEERQRVFGISCMMRFDPRMRSHFGNPGLGKTRIQVLRGNANTFWIGDPETGITNFCCVSSDAKRAFLRRTTSHSLFPRRKPGENQRQTWEYNGSPRHP